MLDLRDKFLKNLLIQVVIFGHFEELMSGLFGHIADVLLTRLQDLKSRPVLHMTVLTVSTSIDSIY
jgi:hypothetical protein